MPFSATPLSYIFQKMALDCAWLLFTMFMRVQNVSALIEMHFNLLLNLVRLVLRSASESIQLV